MKNLIKKAPTVIAWVYTVSMVFYILPAIISWDLMWFKLVPVMDGFVRFLLLLWLLLSFTLTAAILSRND